MHPSGMYVNRLVNLHSRAATASPCKSLHLTAVCVRHTHGPAVYPPRQETAPVADQASAEPHSRMMSGADTSVRGSSDDTQCVATKDRGQMQCPVCFKPAPGQPIDAGALHMWGHANAATLIVQPAGRYQLVRGPHETGWQYPMPYQHVRGRRWRCPHGTLLSRPINALPELYQKQCVL